MTENEAIVADSAKVLGAYSAMLAEMGAPRPDEWYRHYKGRLYRVVGVGLHADEDKGLMVVYQSPAGMLWVWPLSQWLLPTEDGKPRFEKVTEEIP